MSDKEMDFRARHRRAVERVSDSMTLAAVLAQLRPKQRPTLAAIDAAILQRLARQLNALAVAQCNYQWTDRQQKRRERLTGEVREVASWYGLTAECGGDPRGCVVRLHDAKGRLPRNGWGDGFCVG